MPIFYFQDGRKLLIRKHFLIGLTNILKINIITLISIPIVLSLLLALFKLAMTSLTFNPAFSASVLGTTSKASPNFEMEYCSSPMQVFAYSFS